MQVAWSGYLGFPVLSVRFAHLGAGQRILWERSSYVGPKERISFFWRMAVAACYHKARAAVGRGQPSSYRAVHKLNHTNKMSAAYDPNDINEYLNNQAEQGRAVQREREERAKQLASMKLEPEMPKAAVQAIAGATPTEQQSPDAFYRWAETYGNIITELKRSGAAKVPAKGTGTKGPSVNAKTLSEHLRAIRRAIKLFHYQSPLIDSTFDMEPFSFIAVGDWVYVQSRSNKARTEVLSAAPPAMPILLVQTLSELTAVAVVFNLRAGTRARDLAFSNIKLYVPDVDFSLDLPRLFPGCRIETSLDITEIERITGSPIG